MSIDRLCRGWAAGAIRGAASIVSCMVSMYWRMPELVMLLIMLANSGLLGFAGNYVAIG